MERFIKDLGYDPVRNETGGITYGNEFRLEEYCYKEISEIDILVGVVGGNFGSQSGHGEYSITQTEIKTAIEQNKQVYIFIEKNVLAEYETYLMNKGNATVKYRFANDIRIYNFIEELYKLPKNNIIHSFETVLDITSFLKEQWAGLFRDLLMHQIRKAQYDNINSKVSELTEVSATLRTYLENVLENVTKKATDTDKLISRERERLEKIHLNNRMMELPYISHLVRDHSIPLDNVIKCLKNTENVNALKICLQGEVSGSHPGNSKFSCLFDYDAIKEINTAREMLKLTPYDLTPEDTIKMARRRRILRDRPDNKTESEDSSDLISS